MTSVQVTDRDGNQHVVDWAADQSLMECIRDNDLPLLASCGGTASCSTCHVYLPPDVVASLGERSDDELELLEDNQYYSPDVSRLSCQIEFDADLEGLRVTLAPEED